MYYVFLNKQKADITLWQILWQLRQISKIHSNQNDTKLLIRSGFSMLWFRHGNNLNLRKRLSLFNEAFGSVMLKINFWDEITHFSMRPRKNSFMHFWPPPTGWSVWVKDIMTYTDGAVIWTSNPTVAGQIPTSWATVAS